MSPVARVLEDALAASWTLRRKPLESFMLPQAAIGDGMLACSDGSLVSLIRIDGARSMTGAEELERFVELACRRLNSRLAAPGHALHLMLERAPDEAGKQVERICARAGTQASRLGLSLSDVLDERSRYLGTLLAAETVIFACWTRPACLTAAEARRGRKRLRQRLKAWLPEAGEAQCPDAVLDGLEPRHRALMDALGALFDEAGIVAERLDDEAALRTVRVLINGADSTAPDWRPVTPLNERGDTLVQGSTRTRAGTGHRAAGDRRLPASAGAAASGPRSAAQHRTASASAAASTAQWTWCWGPGARSPLPS